MRNFAMMLLVFCTAAPEIHAAPAAPKLTMTDPEANAVVKAPVYMVHLMFDLPVDIRSVSFNVTDHRENPSMSVSRCRWAMTGRC